MKRLLPFIIILGVLGVAVGSVLVSDSSELGLDGGSQREPIVIVVTTDASTDTQTGANRRCGRRACAYAWTSECTGEARGVW